MALKKLSTLLLATVLSILPAINAKVANDDMEALRRRFKSEASAAFDAINKDDILQLAETLDEKGYWPDIDYIDTSNTGFQHTVHLSRITSLARAYVLPDSPLKGNPELYESIGLALESWFQKDWQCENWWHNQIGVPRTFTTLLYILDENLNEHQVEEMLKIALRACMDAPGARQGGDRLLIAGLYAKTVLWERDEKEFESILKLIESEFNYWDAGISYRSENYFGGGRGLEHDFSYHHRQDGVDNTLSYGSSSAESYLEWAEAVVGTRYAFKPESSKLLTDYFLDGICKHMVYGRSDDPGAVNRDNSRKTGKRILKSASMPSRLLKISDYRKDEVERILNARKGDFSGINSYAKFFWKTEYFSFQRPNFFTSVRMFSSRNANMEYPYNGEGILNHFRGDGANYISVRGDEYADISPVFDFRKVPGATIMQSETMPGEKELQKYGQMDFVGGVDDGLYGAAAFDFISPFDPVKARKSWFFLDDCYVCLGSGINCESQREVFTTLNQCFLNGEVTICKTDNTIETVSEGEHSYDALKWVYHDSVGYIFPQGCTNAGLFCGETQGSWRRVVRQASTPSESVKENIFSLWINHGKQAQGAGYAYIVIPGSGIDSVKGFTARRSIGIISNTPALQAVADRDEGVFYANFFAEGVCNFSRRLSISCDSAALVMLRGDKGKLTELSVSDPSRVLDSVRITLKGKISCDCAGVQTSYDSRKKATTLTVKLPEAEFAGQSVTINIVRYENLQ